jgi:carbon storage regulator CsrA
MLVLKRKVREQLVLALPDGRRVVITLLSVGRGTARLGIEAPAGVDISRPEADADREEEDR